MIVHAGLFVRSMETSLEYYRDKMGFSVVDQARVDGEMVRFLTNQCYDVLQISLLKVAPIGAMIELMEVQPESALTGKGFTPVPHTGAIAILVPSLEKFIEERKRVGVHPATETFSVSLPRGGDSVVVLYRDPDGHLLEFVEIRI